MKRIRLALVQVNPVVGDLDGNVERIQNVLDDLSGCDLAVFGEMVLTGYPLEDLVLKPGFVVDSRRALEKIAQSSGECALIVGFADGFDDAVYNSVAVCHRGRVQGIYRKHHLPNSEVFDEVRNFSPGTDAPVLYRIGGVHIGVAICEDLWVTNGPVEYLAANGAELVVVSNGSPFHRGKQAERELRVSSCATLIDRPIAYVNLVGGQDELVFDGGSFWSDSKGNIVARGPRFEEAVVVVDIDVPEILQTGIPIIEVSDPLDHSELPILKPVTSLEPLAELYGALVLATRDYVHKSGFTDVCLGLSGGIDSALVATIARDALGVDHVHAVMMPSRYSSDHSVSDAKELITNLGIDSITIPIESVHKSFGDLLTSSVNHELVGVSDENLQARIRGVLLMSLANMFNWIVLSTGNKSEAAVGYSTLYGDTVGAYAVIKDVYKTVVYELVDWLNNRHASAVIPENIFNKEPSAELRPEQRDLDSLPAYGVLDTLLQAYVEGDYTRSNLLDDGFDIDLINRIIPLVDRAEYKRRQNPPGVRVTKKGFGRDRRLPLVNRYQG